MSLFDSEEAERIKRHRRFIEYQHGQDVAELNRKLEDQMQEASEYVDAESSEMMGKIEALEKGFAELKRQLDELKVKV
jgi:uncharacterized protein YceH (UPF0502 family)